MSIQGFELADFSVHVGWENMLSLPPEEFISSMENTEFELVDSGSNVARYEYTDGSIDIRYDLEGTSVAIQPGELQNFDQSINILSDLLEVWETTDDPNRFTLEGDAIVRYNLSGDRDAGDVLSSSIQSPDMIDELTAPDATSITWRYSNSHRNDTEPAVDIKVEPYVENPEYFYVVVRKRSRNEKEIWDTGKEIESVLEDLIDRLIEE